MRVLEVPIDDSWTRDSGPILVVDGEGRRAGVDFVFNSWGSAISRTTGTPRCPPAYFDFLGIERIPSTMVLEGGR